MTSKLNGLLSSKSTTRSSLIMITNNTEFKFLKKISILQKLTQLTLVSPNSWTYPEKNSKISIWPWRLKRLWQLLFQPISRTMAKKLIGSLRVLLPPLRTKVNAVLAGLSQLLVLLKALSLLLERVLLPSLSNFWSTVQRTEMKVAMVVLWALPSHT